MENAKRIAKENLELMFKLVPTAMFTVDQDMRVTSWNNKAEQITGYSAGEMMGKECRLFVRKAVCTLRIYSFSF
jgi:PAS domain S-box-containing protein